MSDKHVYTTDGKVKLFSRDEEVNIKLGKIIGDKFIQYRKRWDAVNRFELVTEFPLFLQLDMNQNCNLSCCQCIKSTPELENKYYGDNKKALSWETFKEIIHEAQEYDCPSFSPSGINEPLLMKDLEKYLKYAQDHGFLDIIINTNGTLLTEERSKKLLDSGLTRIRFSIDAATPETYEKIRKRGNYYEVIKNIERFLSLKESKGYKLPITGTNFCKISLNEHETNDFLNYWVEKVDQVTIQTFAPLVSSEKFLNYYPSDQMGIGDKLKVFKCPQPFQRINIRNYDIMPCCTFFDSRLKIGNLESDSIYKVWNGEAINQLRDLHKRGDYFKSAICKTCVNLSYPKKLLNKYINNFEKF